MMTEAEEIDVRASVPWTYGLLVVGLVLVGLMLAAGQGLVAVLPAAVFACAGAFVAAVHRQLRVMGDGSSVTVWGPRRPGGSPAGPVTIPLARLEVDRRLPGGSLGAEWQRWAFRVDGVTQVWISPQMLGSRARKALSAYLLAHAAKDSGRGGTE